MNTDTETRLCACGVCGLEVKPGKRFINGHNLRGKSGSQHPTWKGGKTLRAGYVIQTVREGEPFFEMGLEVKPGSGTYQIFEHRLVVAKALKRLLETEEQCHHRNETRTDNRLSNLILFYSNSYHAKHHQNLRSGMNEADSLASIGDDNFLTFDDTLQALVEGYAEHHKLQERYTVIRKELLKDALYVRH